MPHGALIEPLGHRGDALTEDEYKIVRTCLELYRSDDLHLYGIARAVATLEKDATLAKFLSYLVMHIGEHSEQYAGLLVADQFNAQPFQLLNDETECKDLAAFLHVLRNGGWFAEFIAGQVRMAADEELQNPALTPLMLMQALADDVSEFEAQLKSARDMVVRHTELFQDVLPERAGSPNAEPKRSLGAVYRARKAGSNDFEKEKGEMRINNQQHVNEGAPFRIQHDGEAGDFNIVLPNGEETEWSGDGELAIALFADKIYIATMSDDFPGIAPGIVHTVNPTPEPTDIAAVTDSGVPETNANETE